MTEKNDSMSVRNIDRIEHAGLESYQLQAEEYRLGMIDEIDVACVTDGWWYCTNCSNRCYMRDYPCISQHESDVDA